MVTMTLWWLFLIPILLSLASIYVLPKLSNGDVDRQHAMLFAAIGLVISMLIMAGAFVLGKGSKTHDTEVWNGRITSKERKHGSWTESYECMCRTDSKGNRSCSTCYREHYTVDWVAYSTIGSYEIKSLDELDDDVYDEPDPAFYKSIVIGEACSKIKNYTNYIKAVPNSLFRPAAASLREIYKGMLPTYPISIHSEWRIDRVVPVRVNVPNIREWNQRLSESLKDIGTAKQVNAVIVLVNTPDEAYSYALQDAWINGKKNDVVLIIGTTDFPNKAKWVNVLTLTDNTIFPIKLHDEIMRLPTLTAESVVGVLQTNIAKHYKRKSMKDFKYLDAEIDPPLWVNVTTSVLTIIAYLGFWFAVSTGHTPRFSTSYSGHRRRFR